MEWWEEREREREREKRRQEGEEGKRGGRRRRGREREKGENNGREEMVFILFVLGAIPSCAQRYLLAGLRDFKVVPGIKPRPNACR